MTDTTAEKDTRTREEKVAAHNDGLKAARLQRVINRQHEWRVQVWAQSQQRIEKAQAEYVELTGEPLALFEPDFSNAEMVEHYATMTLTPR